jgi:curved DNA-binding protein CbpA
MPDPYDVLGLPAQASREAIERAYRRRVVEAHRLGVFGIVSKFRALQRARNALHDIQQRQRWDELRDLEMGHAGRTETQRRRHEGRILEAYSARRARDARRLSESALRENAEQIVDIERRLLLAEQDEARALRRRWWRGLALRAAALLVAGLALWLWWPR